MISTATVQPFNEGRPEALRRLDAGQCVAVPTETVYGLSADATNGEAVARIFEMKGRPSFNPLIAHVSDQEMAQAHGVFDARARRLADTFWPGPLTLVVPLKDDSPIHPLVTAGLGTVGIRCPKGPARDLIADHGKPLAAPSANRSGRISPTTAAHVRDEFPGEDLLILDAGACDVGLESTIVKCIPDAFSILRPGVITAAMIETASGFALQQATSDIQAPGMMESHYAPVASVLLDWQHVPENAGLLAFGPDISPAGFKAVLNLSERGDLREAAANLYAHLKALDDMDLELICAMPVPQEGLGLAINDRLMRAAAPRPAPRMEAAT